MWLTQNGATQDVVSKDVGVEGCSIKEGIVHIVTDEDGVDMELIMVEVVVEVAVAVDLVVDSVMVEGVLVEHVVVDDLAVDIAVEDV